MRKSHEAMEAETREAYSWYMAERERTAKETAERYGLKKESILSRFRKLGLQMKTNYTHHYEDLAGKRFGRCVVVEKLPRTRVGGIRWKCLCDCGNEFEALAQNLKAGNTKGCGCGRSRGRAPHGDRFIDLSGYAHIQVPGHPRSTKGKGSWVREHIVVMEQVIGRPLLPGETVHHINGIRDDNRPENLELWSSNHPSGQRVEDLVKYSLEILRTYRPDLLRDTTT